MKHTDRIHAGQGVARVRGNAARPLTAILLGAGLALAAATPSLAQSYDPDVGSGNIVPYYGRAPQPGMPQDAANALAQVVPRGVRGGRSAHRRIVPGASAFQSWNLYNAAGGAVRMDPDPNIEFQLHRESLQGRW
jgi:hypothetical protein